MWIFFKEIQILVIFLFLTTVLLSQKFTIIAMFQFFKRLLFGRKISQKRKHSLLQNLKKSQSYTPKEQFIFLDSLYHRTLQEYGYRGTFWEILLKKPKEIHNIEKIWKLHKMRNKMVHELEYELKNIGENIEAYKKEFFKLLK